MVFVESGIRGLEEMAAAPFDVVVADMRMPGMNGAEFLQIVKMRHPSTVRLVLSGHADADMTLQAESAAHQFLTKPCDPDLLRQVILSTTRDSGGPRSDRVLEVIGGIAHLPVLPTIYHEILRLLDSEDASADRLAQVVRRDPGMTANLLKLVNSAYFGLRQRISDPGAAVAFLGLDTLKSLALLHGIFQQVKEVAPELNVQLLWTHSFDVAAASRQIAHLEGLDRTTQSDAFTGGLLHDVGLVILASSFRDAYRQIARDMATEPGGLIGAEVRHLGTHHGEVGGYLLNLWGLPEVVVRAVVHHHDPRPSDEGTLDPALVVLGAECILGGAGDCRLFGLQGDPDPGQVERLLDPDRRRKWLGFLEAMQPSRGTP
jgi:HD-like signal output (HDOD) protein/CheY-like chemotaxis protein